MPKTWFQFKNVSEDEAEVSIYDAIGYYGVSAKSFVDELKKHNGKKVTVRINSPGGVVTEGLAIFNALKRHKAGVIIQIDALAASMATYIALAGAPVRMAANAYFMIHNVSGGAWGTVEEIRKAADVAEKLQDGIVAAYVAKTGQPEEEIREKMKDETWFDAEEALEFGFVDEITDALEAAACMGEEGRAILAKFRNPPVAIVDSSTRSTAENRSRPTMKILTASLATLLTASSGITVTEASTEAEVKAALDGVSGKITALQTDKTNLTNELTAEKGKVTDLTGKLDIAQKEVTKLTNEAKTVDDRAKEIAAAFNSNSGDGKKGKTEAENAGGQPDGKSHYDAYQAAMKEGDGAKASRIWTDHFMAIEAYVATL